MEQNGFRYETQNQEPQKRNEQGINGLEIVSLVGGIIALTAICYCPYLGIIMGIVAIVTGAMSKDEDGNKPAIAKIGIWLGIAGIAVIVLFPTLNMLIAIYDAYFGG